MTEPEVSRMTGVIKITSPTFGFITTSNGMDFFFHVDDLLDGFDVKVGDEVTFEAVTPQPLKGARARGVSFVAGARS